MRFVHDQKADASRYRQEHVFDEFVIGQAFGGDQQRVRGVAADLFAQRRPILPVRGVDGDCSDAKPVGRFDLVAHQGQ